MAAFGFSVGDFFDGIELVRQLINALKSGAGSSKEYQDLIHELYHLEKALLEVKQLRICESLAPQKKAIEQVATQCQDTISQFLEKISKYQPSLRSGGSGSSWRDRLRKIQWALYRKEDVQKFRAQIQGHTSSTMTLLMALQLKTTTLNAQASSSSQSLSHSSHENQLVRFNQTMAENAAFLRALAEMLPTLQRIVSNNDQPSESHESNELSNVMKEVRETNLEIYRMVLKMQLSLPAQVEDQKPVYFLDACAFQARIDLTWINSWEAFLAVLGVRFKQRGLKIVERKQFVLEDANSKLLVDGNRPFESCFIPGRKINMDAFLDEKGNTGKCCPSCRYEELDAKADQAIDCTQCGTHYRRIEIVEEVVRASLPAPARRNEPLEGNSRIQRWLEEVGTEVAATVEIEPDDDLSQFRRIRLRNRKMVELYPCPVHGCKMTFSTLVDLKEHQANQHTHFGASSYWSVSEEMAFRSYLAEFGTEGQAFENIATRMGTKTAPMVRNRYVKLQREGKHPEVIETAETANFRLRYPEPSDTPPETGKFLANGPWQSRLMEYTQRNGLPRPTYTIASDKRGGKTAWGCTVEIGNGTFPADYWYSEDYVHSAREVAASVALKYLEYAHHQRQEDSDHENVAEIEMTSGEDAELTEEIEFADSLGSQIEYGDSDPPRPRSSHRLGYYSLPGYHMTRAVKSNIQYYSGPDTTVKVHTLGGRDGYLISSTGPPPTREQIEELKYLSIEYEEEYDPNPTPDRGSGTPDIDTENFFATLHPSLRKQILAEADDATVTHLPPSLAAEARALKLGLDFSPSRRLPGTDTSLQEDFPAQQTNNGL